MATVFGRQVDHGVDGLRLEDGVERGGVAAVGLDQPAVGRHRRGVPFLEVVDDDDAMAASESPLHHDGADVASSPVTSSVMR